MTRALDHNQEIVELNGYKFIVQASGGGSFSIDQVDDALEVRYGAIAVDYTPRDRPGTQFAWFESRREDGTQGSAWRSVDVSMVSAAVRATIEALLVQARVGAFNHLSGDK